MRSKGKVVVIAGPVGVGKNSTINEIVKRRTDCVDLVTATTRALRPGEKNGVDYFFMTEAEFDENIGNGNIIEVFRHPAGFRNGIYEPFLRKHIDKGETVIGDITFSGARFLKEHYGALCIFMMPPSFDVLERRIISRHADMPTQELTRRLTLAKHEIEEESSWYDYRVVNEDGKLNEAVDTVIEILKKEGYIKDDDTVT